MVSSLPLVGGNLSITTPVISQLNFNESTSDALVELYMLHNQTGSSFSTTAIISVSWQACLVLILMLTTITANSVMCYAVYRTPNLRTMTNIFTINLGISDLGVAVISLPMFLVTLTQNQVSPPSSQFCNVVSCITVTLLLVSVATLAGISLDRYFSICHPLRYPIEVTGRRGYMSLAYIWVHSITLAAMPFMGLGRYAFRPQSVPICQPQWTHSTTYAAIIVSFGLGIPFVIMLFSYIRIIQEASRQAQRIEELKRASSLDCGSPCKHDDKDQLVPQDRRLSIFTHRWHRTSVVSSGQVYSSISRNLKTLKTVFIVVGAFFVCWCPYVCIHIWGQFLFPRRLPYFPDLITTVLVFSNSALNPFVFMLLTRDLRHTVHLLLKKHFSRASLGEVNASEYKRRSSAIGLEVIRLHSRESRGSLDSGVELDPLARSFTNRLSPNQYENDAYEKSSYSDSEERLSNQFLALPKSRMGCGHMPNVVQDNIQPIDDLHGKMPQKLSSIKPSPNVAPIFHNIPTIVVLGQVDDV